MIEGKGGGGKKNKKRKIGFDFVGEKEERGNGIVCCVSYPSLFLLLVGNSHYIFLGVIPSFSSIFLNIGFGLIPLLPFQLLCKSYYNKICTQFSIFNVTNPNLL